jgi:hypothetical protein
MQAKVPTVDEAPRIAVSVTKLPGYYSQINPWPLSPAQGLAASPWQP